MKGEVPDPMEYVRCRCDKIVAQLNGHQVVIKCRHCKRSVVITLDPRPSDAQPVIEYRDDTKLESATEAGQSPGRRE